MPNARAERHLDKVRFCRRCIDGKFRALMKLAGDNWGRFSLTCEKGGEEPVKLVFESKRKAYVASRTLRAHGFHTGASVQ